MSRLTRQQVEKWWKEFISLFRRQHNTLSEKEKDHVSNLDDFLAPCQIDSIHFTNPEMQIVIVTHFEEQPDQEITIHGPTPAHNYVDVLERLIQHPKWEVQLTEEEQIYLISDSGVFRDILDSHLVNAASWMRRNALRRQPTQVRPLKWWVSARCFCWYLQGNLAETDPIIYITDIVKSARESITASELVDGEVAESLPVTEKGYGTYFYPAIWIGKLPHPPLRQTLAGNYSPLFFFREKALDTSFNGKCVVVNRDGYVAISGECQDTVHFELNLIMATAMLHSIPVFALRKFEIGEVTINKEQRKITSSSGISGSMRLLQASPQSFQSSLFYVKYIRTHVSRKHLRKIIRRAETIAQHPKLSEYLITLLQGWTHFQNTEYTQSFLVSWITVERCLFQHWLAFLTKKGIGHGKQEKLSRTPWTVSIVQEVLKLTKQLSNNQCERIAELRGIRNQVVHKGADASKDQAWRCFELGLELLKSHYPFLKRWRIATLTIAVNPGSDDKNAS